MEHWTAAAIAVLGASTAGLFAWALAHRKHDREVERWRGQVDTELKAVKEEVSTLGDAVTELGTRRSEGDGELHKKIEDVTREVSTLSGQLRELIGVLKGAKILDSEKG